MNIVAIIQARYHSTRLPNKTMFKLNNKTVLEHVLERCKKIDNINAVCCAISDDRESDIIEFKARKSEVYTFRGSEKNVLKRYYQAALYMEADIILRVTSDCPLIDPFICKSVIRNLIENNADYSCNNFPPTWPHGLDCEAFTFNWLNKAYQNANTKFDLEHVTPYIRNHEKINIVNLECPIGNYKSLRWTLDTVEDLKFFKLLFSHLEKEDFGWEYPLKVVKNNPEISKVNLAIIDKKRISS